MKKWQQKHWFWSFIGLLSIAAVVFAVRHELEKRAQARRDTVYETILRSYTDALPPGLRRDEVESYLRSKSVKFQQMCCVERKGHPFSVYDDLAKIGQEDAPWFCRENNVYVAFHFTGQRPDTNFPASAEGNDRLTQETIFHWLEDCM